MPDVTRARALCNLLVSVVGFCVGWVARAFYDRLVLPNKRLSRDLMHTIVRAACGMVLMISTAFLAVTLDPVWVLSLASFALGAFVGVRAWLLLNRRRHWNTTPFP